MRIEFNKSIPFCVRCFLIEEATECVRELGVSGQPTDSAASSNSVSLFAGNLHLSFTLRLFADAFRWSLFLRRRLADREFSLAQTPRIKLNASLFKIFLIEFVGVAGKTLSIIALRIPLLKKVLIIPWTPLVVLSAATAAVPMRRRQWWNWFSVSAQCAVAGGVAMGNAP